MNTWNIQRLALVLFCLGCGAEARAEFVSAGRAFDPEKRSRLTFTIGDVSDIDGGVNETSRRLFEVTGERDRIKGQESYSFKELGVDSSETTYGLSYERFWKYFTGRLDASYLTAEADGVAQRDYFIGVNEVSFRGKDYEYMKLEGGEPYDASLDSIVIGARGLITPVTFNPDGAIQFVPWIDIGIFAVAGEYDVDAGPAQRIQIYENPPREYVVGGSGSGDANAFIPEIGAGGELQFRLGERLGQPVTLSVEGTYAVFDIQGSTGDFGIGSADKDLDATYDTTEVRVFFTLPVSTATDLVIGGGYRVINVDADVEAKDRSLEETLARREKFDKHVTLEMTMISGYLGLRW